MSETGRNVEVESTSDDRVRNNLMRHKYRELNEVEKRNMQELKDAGLNFVNLLTHIGHGGTANSDINPLKPGQASRELSIAQTKMEEAVMWAVKHVTG